MSACRNSDISLIVHSLSGGAGLGSWRNHDTSSGALNLFHPGVSGEPGSRGREAADAVRVCAWRVVTGGMDGGS